MELNMKETALSHVKKLFETSAEQSIDTDFTMPDYYPEVEKILKCMTEINVMSAQCEGGTVSIGGQAVFTVLFADSSGALNSFLHIFPFVKVCDINDVGSGAVKVTPKVNYINVKATGPRKIELHGSVGLNFNVCGVVKKTAVEEISAEGVYQKTGVFNVFEPQEYILKSVFCEEDISVGQNKPAVGKILRTAYDAKITECKYISEKAVIKGDLNIEMLYCPNGKGTPVKLTEVRGFSCVVDCPNLSGDVSFDCSASVESFDLRPKTSLDGEVRNIAFEAKIGICILPLCALQKCVTVDAFSSKNHADIQKDSVYAESLVEKIKESTVVKKTVDCQGVSVDEIYDIWCKPSVDYTSAENGEVLVKGEVTVSILGRSGEDTVFAERVQDYEYRHSIGDMAESVRFSPAVSVMAQSYSINSEGSVDVSVELLIEGNAYAVTAIDAVTKIRVEDSCILKDDTAIILYFADNETPWSVARKYSTSPEAVCSANGIENVDESCSKMLLVPIV